MDETLLLDTTRFGTVGYTNEDVVVFEDGLIGFPEHRHFLLLSHKPESPFRWLQNIEEPQVAFLLADPSEWVPTYNPIMSDSQAESLHMTDTTPRLLYVTVTIPPGSPAQMTVNLMGPIVINLSERLATQLVLQDETYTTKHRVFPQADRVGDAA